MVIYLITYLWKKKEHLHFRNRYIIETGKNRGYLMIMDPVKYRKEILQQLTDTLVYKKLGNQNADKGLS